MIDYEIDNRIMKLITKSTNKSAIDCQSNKNSTIDYKIDFQRSTIAYRIDSGIKNCNNRSEQYFVAFGIP